MFTMLLIVIYLAFISLGLPDSLLGAAWPSMHGALGAAISQAGIISTVIAAGTIVSSLCSEKLIRRLGTGLVTLLSVAMTAVALFGFSTAGSVAALCLWAIPYGLGAGSVDAALNNFVALHYGPRHMNWLHCFWGIGATAGPYIMGMCMAKGRGWSAGYQTVGLIQTALAVCLLASLPLWQRHRRADGERPEGARASTLRGVLRLSGARPMLAAFFCYCALEATAGLWAGSYMTAYRAVPAERAAKYVSLFYLGITLGRFLGGLVAGKLGDRMLVRAGLAAACIGIALMLTPIGEGLLPAGLAILGLGCAPIYPSLLHETPENFGQDASQAVMGMQMASAYTGTTLMPLLFGAVTARVGTGVYPVFLLLLAAALAAMTERANRRLHGDGALIGGPDEERSAALPPDDEWEGATRRGAKPQKPPLSHKQM